MDVGDPSGEGILDRDHAEIGLPPGNRVQGVLKRRTRKRLVVGIGFFAGDMGVGA
jgi:hypothetical protein